MTNVSKNQDIWYFTGLDMYLGPKGNPHMRNEQTPYVQCCSGNFWIIQSQQPACHINVVHSYAVCKRGCWELANFMECFTSKWMLWKDHWQWRCFLAEVRATKPEAMYSDADETWSVWLGQCLFHGGMQDMIDEMIWGIRESVYELYVLLHVRGQGSRMRAMWDVQKIWWDFLELMILKFLPLLWV